MNDLILGAAPKKFEGNIATIQDNAIKSWVRLFGAENIILFGDKTIEKEAKRLGVKYEYPETTNSGLPLLNSIFNICRSYNKKYIAYINSDIILFDDFVDSLEFLDVNFKQKFLLVGRRTNLNIENNIDFLDNKWQSNLILEANKNGVLVDRNWIDYFCFPTAVFSDIPALRIGRAGFDNYLLYKAKKDKVKIIDATDSILAIHQNHNYAHHPQDKSGVWYGEDAQENLKLAGGYCNYFSLLESDFKLIDGCLKKNINPFKYYFTRRYFFNVLPTIIPFFSFLFLIKKLIKKYIKI